MKKRWLNLLLVGGLLLAGLIPMAWMHLDRAEGAEVSVCVNGEEIARLSLSDDGAHWLNGGSNLLLIEDGAARMAEADCPDALCVRQGSVRYGGQCITCLPNRLTVTVCGSGEVELFG